MSDQSTETTTSQDDSVRGPVAPQKPDVSAFGKRGRRVAAAQRASTSPATNTSTRPDESTTDAPAGSLEPSGQRSEQSEAAPEPVWNAVSPTEPAEPAAPRGSAPESDSRQPHNGYVSDAPASIGAADAAARDEQNHELEDTSDDEDDEDDYTTGKTTRQTYVPDALAARFRRLQQTGKTAETIVLTAVEQCSDRVPDLIQQARGPVQEGGLFPGLPVIDGAAKRNSKTRTNDRPNHARIQYQVAPQYMPALLDVARRHKLKLSKLVRLALGDYFGIPVRLDRVK